MTDLRGHEHREMNTLQIGISLKTDDQTSNYPLATLYKIKVKTGDVLNAGTDADVHMCLYGDKGNTGKIPLKNAIHTNNKFERDR